MQLKTENMQKAAMRKNTWKAKSKVQNSYFIQKRNMTRGTSNCESLKKNVVYQVPTYCSTELFQLQTTNFFKFSNKKERLFGLKIDL